MRTNKKCFDSLVKFEKLIDDLNFIKIVNDDGTRKEPTDAELLDIVVQEWYNVSGILHENGISLDSY